MAINFFEEDIKFNLPKKQVTKRWLKQVAAAEGYQIKNLNYIFCSDEYLYHINKEYLNHNTYTDIITFDNSDKERVIEGDIFISIDRVEENADNQKIIFENELTRVLCHGLFHLLGYPDKSPEAQKQMRFKENQAIRLFYSICASIVPRGTSG